MSVKINLGAWSSVFAVPSKIVDEGLKFSDGVKLKVLLYVLRNADRELDLQTISKATGVNVTDHVTRTWSGESAPRAAGLRHVPRHPLPSWGSHPAWGLGGWLARVLSRWAPRPACPSWKWLHVAV